MLSKFISGTYQYWDHVTDEACEANKDTIITSYIEWVIESMVVHLATDNKYLLSKIMSRLAHEPVYDRIEHKWVPHSYVISGGERLQDKRPSIIYPDEANPLHEPINHNTSDDYNTLC